MLKSSLTLKDKFSLTNIDIPPPFSFKSKCSSTGLVTCEESYPSNLTRSTLFGLSQVSVNAKI